MARLKLNREQIAGLERQLGLPQSGGREERLNNLKRALRKPENRNTLAALRGEQQETGRVTQRGEFETREDIREDGDVTTTGRGTIPVQGERLDLDESLSTPGTVEDQILDNVRQIRNRQGFTSQEINELGLEVLGVNEPSTQEERELSRLIAENEIDPSGTIGEFQQRVARQRDEKRENEQISAGVEEVEDEVERTGGLSVGEAVNEFINESSQPEVEVRGPSEQPETDQFLQQLAQTVSNEIQGSDPQIVDEFIDDQLSDQAEFELRQNGLRVTPAIIEARKNQLRTQLGDFIDQPESFITDRASSASRGR